MSLKLLLSEIYRRCVWSNSSRQSSSAECDLTAAAGRIDLRHASFRHFGWMSVFIMSEEGSGLICQEGNSSNATFLIQLTPSPAPALSAPLRTYNTVGGLTCFHSLLSAPLKWSSFWVNHCSSDAAPCWARCTSLNLRKPLTCPCTTAQAENTKSSVTVLSSNTRPAQAILTETGNQLDTCDFRSHMTSWSVTSKNVGNKSFLTQKKQHSHVLVLS